MHRNVRLVLLAPLITATSQSCAASGSAPRHGNLGGEMQSGRCLLQHNFQKSSLQRLPTKLEQDTHALEVSVLTSDAGYDDGPGIAKFWTIALSSFFMATALTLAFWWWFFHHRSFQDQDEVSSDEEEEEADEAKSRLLLSKNPGLNKQLLNWKSGTHEDRLEMAALTTLILSSMMGVYGGLRFVHRPACAPFKPNVHIPEMLILFCLIAMSGICWLRPRGYLYWPALGLLLLYVPAVALPPFNLSCQMLQSKACQESAHWRISQAQNHVDCSLQGQTAQQIFLTVILLLPWLLTEMKFLYLMFIWMFAVYLIWSVAYFRYSGDTGALAAFTSVDVLARAILMSFTLLAAIFKKYYVQKSQQNKYMSDLARREATRKLYNTLEFMLPSHLIMRMLMEPGEPIAESIDEVSILFIVIDDFETIVKKKTPELLLRFLNQYFCEFDDICQRKGVMKIETVGEEYVCAVGVTPEDIDESKTHGHVSILRRMFKAVSAIMHLQNETVKFKMGMHTGPVVAGVIAQKLPRFRLFGDTINTAARMMQKGQVGMLQFGEETQKHLLATEIEAKPHGLVEMKGKGEVQTFTFSPMARSTSVVTYDADDDDPKCPAASGDLLKVILDHPHPQRHFHGVDVPSPQCSPQGSTQPASYETQTRFQDVVTEMAAETTRKAATLISSPLQLRKQRWLMSEKEGFTAEMEQEFRLQFHKNHTTKKIARRLDYQFVGIFCLSVMEFLWNLPSPQYPNFGWSREHDIFGTWARPPLFIGSRMFALLILIILRMRSVSKAVKENIHFQTWLVCGSCGVSLALFLSYDVMITGSLPSEEVRKVAPFDQIFSLVFVLLFVFLCSGHKVLFNQSLAFIPLALLLVACTNIRSHCGVYFPIMGQVLFVVIAISFSALAHSEEQSLRARFKALSATENTKKRVEAILKTMMPPMVLAEVQDSLKDNAGSSDFTHHQYELATIAQSDLCGFTKIAAGLKPTEVVRFISDLFGKFDTLTDKHGVYKVETVGDAYIGGQAEFPLTEDNSPTQVIQFGIAMISEVNAWSKRVGLPVKCRVGVHHGQCIGGIVDRAMQRYHIFGELMHVIEILESTAPEGGIQVSDACREAVLAERRETGETEKPELQFQERLEPHLVTSKLERHEYSEVGGRSYVIQGPALQIASAQVLKRSSSLPP